MPLLTTKEEQLKLYTSVNRTLKKRNKEPKLHQEMASQNLNDIPQGRFTDRAVMMHQANPPPPLGTNTPPGLIQMDGRMLPGVERPALRRLARNSCTKTAQTVVYEQNLKETLASIPGLTLQD